MIQDYNPLKLRKEDVGEKLKTSDPKIKEKKARYNWNRKTAMILALSWVNVGKYDFLMGEDVSPKNLLLEKAAIIKRFEFLPLDSALKKQIYITIKKLTKEKYQRLDKVYQFSKTVVNKKSENQI